MFDLLAAYLDTLATPEQRQEILDACNTLVDCGVTAHHFAIEQEIGLADVVDHDLILGVCHSALVPAYSQAFSQLGVVVSEEATIGQMADILRALDGLDNYSDSETIIGLVQGEGDACDVLAEILPLTGQFPVETYLSLITYVSPDLLTQIEHLHKEPAEALDNTPVDNSAIVARLKRFLELPNVQAHAGSLVEGAIENGTRVGAPITELVEPYLERLDAMDGDTLGRELTGLALATSVSDKQVHSLIKQVIEHLPLDVRTATAVDVSVGKLLKQVFANA